MSKFENNTVGDIGRVESIINEICTLSGLQSVALNNLIEFSSGEKGLVLGFTKDEVQAIIFGDSSNIKKGDLVRISNPICQ
jgi:F0F1-type ATP synthase alpha subunit